MRRLIALTTFIPTLFMTTPAVEAADFLSDANSATFESFGNGANRAPVAKLQILLDRAHMSPGVVDGRLGENVRKAVRAFEKSRGFEVDGEVDAEVWSALDSSHRPVMRTYKITSKDVQDCPSSNASVTIAG